MCRIYPSACQGCAGGHRKGPRCSRLASCWSPSAEIVPCHATATPSAATLGCEVQPMWPPASLTPPRTSVPLTSSSKVLWRALQGKQRGCPKSPLGFFSFNSSLSLNPTQHQEAGSSVGCLTPCVKSSASLRSSTHICTTQQPLSVICVPDDLLDCNSMCKGMG